MTRTGAPPVGFARIPVVSVVEEKLRTTSLSLTVGYGARHDPVGRGGVAHLLEHLLMSTPVAGVPSFCEYVERLGGYVNARTAPEMTQFYAQVRADDADEIAELLHTAVLAPELDAERLSDERAVVLRELATGVADPADAVQDAFLAEFFAGHDLGRPVGGVPEELAAVTVEDLRVEHATNFLTSPMVLVVVGPRVPKPLVDAPAPGSGAVFRVGSTPPAPARQDRLPAWPTDESLCWVCMGAASPRTNDPDRAAYNVVAKLLGSSPSSLLYRSLRTQEGLAYSFQAWHRGYADAGVWRLLVAVDPASAPRLVEIVRELLAALATDGPTPDDLEAARRQAVMGLIRDSESPLEQANLIGARSRAGTTAWSLDDDLAQDRKSVV